MTVKTFDVSYRVKPRYSQGPLTWITMTVKANNDTEARHSVLVAHRAMGREVDTQSYIVSCREMTTTDKE